MTGAVADVSSSIELAAPSTCRTFRSFDRGTQGVASLQQPDRYRYWDQIDCSTLRISRGAGLSYAAASFLEGGLSVSHVAFNRIRAFDSETGIVEVEAGISLSELHRFLSGHGLYLPVQPGHGRITIGGCIAADVHGKNQMRDGTFMNQIDSLVLFHPSHGMLELSRENNPDLFRLTCGGYGLTGHVILARLRARPIPHGVLRMKATPFFAGDEGLKALPSIASQADWAYTWHDMARGGKKFAGGLLFCASFDPNGINAESDHSLLDPPILCADARADFPAGLLNRYSVYVLNTFYRFRQRAVLRGVTVSLQDALFPIHRVQTYFKLFGRNGFHEYQAILPVSAAADYLEAIRQYLRRQPLAITLASAKFFAGSRELLRFRSDGICLALNFPRGQAASRFMLLLDELVIAHGGMPNIIKDSRLPRAVVDACYPGVEEFRSALLAFDPKRLFRSELSQRLGL